jgi:hypothetical protein
VQAPVIKTVFFCSILALNLMLTDPIYRVVKRERWDEEYPWLRDLTDEQIWQIWFAYDRAYNQKRPVRWPEDPVTTFDQAIEAVGFLLEGWALEPEQLEDLEDELERGEEYRLAAWMRKLRHERESFDEERARYEGYEEHAEWANERLIEKRRRRKPRN